jgi:hypothetical protein
LIAHAGDFMLCSELETRERDEVTRLAEHFLKNEEELMAEVTRLDDLCADWLVVLRCPSVRIGVFGP